MTITADAEILPALSVRGWVERSFGISSGHGFHDSDEPEGGTTPSRRLLLIIGELIEAFEEIRSGHGLNEIYYTYDVVWNGVKFKGLTTEQLYALTRSTPEQLGLTGKPEGVPVEIADTAIRLFDFCGTYGIDLEREVAIKSSFNEGRPFKHGRSF